VEIKHYQKKTSLKMPLHALLKATNSLQKSGNLAALIKYSKENKLHVSVHPDLVNAVKQHLAQNAHPKDAHAANIVKGDCDRPKPDCFGDDAAGG